jgi:nicotinamidase-related amidase
MRKILIVVDMQNDFVTGSLGSAEAQAIVPNVVEKVRTWDPNNLYFTLDTHHSNYKETLEGKYLPVEHCVWGTNGWKLIDELFSYVEEDSQLIDKYTFGFEGWGRKYFDDYDDVEFELVGLCTDICVVSNALALRMFYPNAKITVDASCCAGVTPEKHLAALEVMKSCQIEVINE